MFISLKNMWTFIALERIPSTERRTQTHWSLKVPTPGRPQLRGRWDQKMPKRKSISRRYVLLTNGWSDWFFWKKKRKFFYKVPFPLFWHLRDRWTAGHQSFAWNMYIFCVFWGTFKIRINIYLYGLSHLSRFQMLQFQPPPHHLQSKQCGPAQIWGFSWQMKSQSKKSSEICRLFFLQHWRRNLGATIQSCHFWLKNVKHNPPHLDLLIGAAKVTYTADSKEDQKREKSWWPLAGVESIHDRTWVSSGRWNRATLLSLIGFPEFVALLFMDPGTAAVNHRKHPVKVHT